jgi:hypothetical protein
MNTDNTQDGAEPSPACAGSHADAWAVEHGGSIVYVAIRANDAQEWAGGGPVDVVPLYLREPPTDAELYAIRWAADTLCVGWDDLKPDDKDRSRKAADTLRRMLERIG